LIETTRSRNNIFKLNLIGDPKIPLGYINTDDATLYLNPLCIQINNENFLAIDYELLHSKILCYAYIEINVTISKFETTRLFWKRAEDIEGEYNLRHVKLLPIRKFGLHKALVHAAIYEGRQLELFHNNGKTEVVSDGRIYKK